MPPSQVDDNFSTPPDLTTTNMETLTLERNKKTKFSHKKSILKLTWIALVLRPGRVVAPFLENFKQLVSQIHESTKQRYNYELKL